MIHTQGAQNTVRGQIRTIKDRTTDPTKASATPQTKKRLPRAQVAHFTAAVYPESTDGRRKDSGRG